MHSEPPALLFGATSIIGFTVARLFPERVTPVANPFNGAHAAAAWRQVRVEDAVLLRSVFAPGSLRLVIYCHAVCDVAKCEADPGWAHDINVGGVETVLELLPAATRFVYVSSDHVFGGDGAYSEDCMPSPISVYGCTRVAAEQRVLSRPGSLVIRAGLPIGPSLNRRTGHLDWLRYRYRRGLPITIVRDESRSAVWAEDLAERVMALADSTVCGLRHVAAHRAVGRPELAQYLMERQGLPPAFALASRAEQAVPHLGHVEIRSRYADEYSVPLPPVVLPPLLHARRPARFSAACFDPPAGATTR
jgi:dTDP-4-dehydrorhamnose reductase